VSGIEDAWVCKEWWEVARELVRGANHRREASNQVEGGPARSAIDRTARRSGSSSLSTTSCTMAWSVSK
jgi:hypothetical protein